MTHSSIPSCRRSFASAGFVVGDLLDADRVATLRSVVDELSADVGRGMHTTIQSPDVEYRRRVLERIPPLVTDLFDGLLDDHDLLREPGHQVARGRHRVLHPQDWTMVNKRHFRSVNTWIPLVDVDEANGALAVLPGSHLALDHLRCSPMNPAGFTCEVNEISHHELDTVPLRAGQVLYFDNGLLHGSAPNLTDGPRVAVIVAMKPREAQILHYFLPDAGGLGRPTATRSTRPSSPTTSSVSAPATRSPGSSFYGTPRTRDELLRAWGASRCRRSWRLGCPRRTSTPPRR